MVAGDEPRQGLLAETVTIIEYCLVDGGIKILKTGVQRFHLELLLAVLLKHDERHGEDDEQRQDGEIEPRADGQLHASSCPTA